MTANKPKPELSEDEIAKRRDKGLRNLLRMPPKPHDKIVGKSNSKGKPQPKRKKRTPDK